MQEWPRVLDIAVAKDFDQHELLGIIAAVVFATWLLEPEANPDISLAAVYIQQMFFSIPFLVCLAGPFFYEGFAGVLPNKLRKVQRLKQHQLSTTAHRNSQLAIKPLFIIVLQPPKAAVFSFCKVQPSAVWMLPNEGLAKLPMMHFKVWRLWQGFAYAGLPNYLPSKHLRPTEFFPKCLPAAEQALNENCSF